MSNFRVGQKVVCVDDNWGPPIVGTSSGIYPPHKGTVLTIARLRKLWGSYFLAAEEYPPNIVFETCHFRPAVERGEETGLAILRKLLTDNRVDA